MPWASRLKQFKAEPEPVIELLELLKDHPSRYVRRSVANNLNDIGKDNPARLVSVAVAWMQNASAERKRIVKHGLRSAVKRGEPGALQVLGYGDGEGVFVYDISVEPSSARSGESILIRFDVVNENPVQKNVMVDFQLYYVKANGGTRPKVFKLKAVEMAAHERIAVRKKISLKEMTSRKHYSGVHAIDALLNGREVRIGQFHLRVA